MSFTKDKMLRILMLLTLLLGCFSSCQNSAEQADPISDEWTNFIGQDKFVPSDRFVGNVHENLRLTLENLINQSAEEFRAVSESENPTNEKYWPEMDKGLARFNEYRDQLGTLEKEEICYYFQDLMEICGLESSGGRLNIFLYPALPNDILKTDNMLFDGAHICSFDQNTFNEQMGLGFMELQLRPNNYYEEDSLMLAKKGKNYILKLYDRPGWELLIGDQDASEIIQPFASHGFANHYQYIWHSGSRQDSNVVIQSNLPQADQFKITSGDRFFLVKWENYLMNHLIAIDSSCNIYTQYQTRETVQPKPTETNVYSITNVRNEWIEISYVDPSDPEGKKEMQAIGWMRWFCHGQIRIKFLDDIQMETYFYN